MADRITLNFDANTGEAEKGTQRIADGLKKVEDGLEDVNDAASGASDSTSDVEDSLKDVERQASRTGRSASDDLEDVGDAADDTAKKVEEIGDAGDKSADGLESLTGALLGAATLAGGIGALASKGIDIAADFVVEAIEKQKKAAEELKVALTSAYQAAAEEGRTFLTEAQIIAIAADTLFDTEKREDARSEAERIGIDMQTYIRAQAGDQEALNAVIATTTQKIKEAAEEQAKLPGQYDQLGAEAGGVLPILESILKENEGILETIENNKTAAEDYRELVGATRDDFVSMRDVISEIPEKKTFKIEADTTELDKALAKQRTITVKVLAKTGEPIF